MAKNKQNNFNQNVEFGAETDVNQVRQQNQQSEARKNQASGQRANQYGQQAEFGSETDVNQVRQQNQQSTRKK